MKTNAQSANEMNEIAELERKFNEGKKKIEVKNKYRLLTGIEPKYVSEIYKKTLLSFEVSNLQDAKVISDSFEGKINAILRSATDEKETASPYFTDFKRYEHTSNIEVCLHFETETEYVDIHVPFDCFPSHLLTSAEYEYTGERLELARYRRTSKTYKVYHLSGFDCVRFYGGSVKCYVALGSDENTILQFEKTIFQLS